MTQEATPTNDRGVRDDDTAEPTACHGQKLRALASNQKLPRADRPKVNEALDRYAGWVTAMDRIGAVGDDLLTELVRLLNEYKRYIEIDLIFDSSKDFLYRHKGQHKVDNSILEEFLPRLADVRLVPGLRHLQNPQIGPQKSFAAFSFGGNVLTPLSEGGVYIKSKNQDYALSKKVWIRASTTPAFEQDSTFSTILNVAYLAAECKTNLDKTMFNEGLETARALKQAVAGAHYLLICEWLDMSPIDTAITDIDEAIILRKARRLPADFREQLSSVRGRRVARPRYVGYFEQHSLSVDSFRRIVRHMNKVFPDVLELDEHTVLTRGYF